MNFRREAKIVYPASRRRAVFKGRKILNSVAPKLEMVEMEFSEGEKSKNRLGEKKFSGWGKNLVLTKMRKKISPRVMPRPRKIHSTRFCSVGNLNFRKFEGVYLGKKEKSENTKKVFLDRLDLFSGRKQGFESKNTILLYFSILKNLHHKFTNY